MQSDVYSLGMIILTIVTDGMKPFYNLPWDEAIINSLRRGERYVGAYNVYFLCRIGYRVDVIVRQYFRFNSLDMK